MNIIEVVIEGLNSVAKGYGYYQGKKIFIADTLPGEKVKAAITLEKKEIIEAKLVELLTTSPDRSTPPCKYYIECGGCSLQHLKPDFYQSYKNNLLVKPLLAMGVDRTSITEPVIIGANSRRKASFKIGGSGNKIKFGFYNNQSHQIANIDYCMVLEPAINELIPHLKQLILNLTIKISEISILNSDSGIDLLFYSNEEPTLKQGQQIVEFAKKFNISRVSIDIKGAIYSVIKFTSIQLHIGDARIDLPEKCFIQASRQSQQYITNMIIKHIGNSKKIIDLYAGCGTYSFALAKTAKIHAVEGASDMVKAIEKTGIITAEKRDLHNNPVTAKELSKYQAVVINPPRNGASRQISEIASSNINKVIMVSCNPQTFASDAKILLGSGFKLTIATAIDQFYFSNHLEICSFFTRGGA